MFGSPRFKEKKIRVSFRENIEPQEIFLDSLAKKKEEELGISQKKFETPLSRGILLVFLIFVLFSYLLLFAKSFQLQVIEGKEYQSLAERNKFRVYQIQAERGVVYDAGGKQLVWNKPSYDLVLDRRFFSRDEAAGLKILEEISPLLNRNPEDLKKEVQENGSSEILLAENLSHQNLILLETKIGDFPGFQIKNSTVREYRLGPDFAHILGYTGKIKSEEFKAEPDLYSIFDWVGRSGIEKSYEPVLRKNPGRLRLETDARGNILSEEVLSLPESGKSLVLWLDSDLQKKIKEELQKAMANVGASRATAIALNPKTGGVLAMLSLPDFDNNLFQKGADPQALKAVLEDSSKPLLNRVIAGLYPTGSTIKPLVASAALEEKIIDPEKLIYDPGKIEVSHRYDPQIIYTYNDWAVHGWVDIRKALAVSCNVYFYTIGGGYKGQAGLGPSRIKKYLSLFGWGSATDIDLPGEKEGLLPSPEWKKEVKKENWWDGDTYHFAIGQGDLLVTPLQVAAAFSAIANGGKLLVPKIVQKIVDKDKNPLSEIKPEVVRENFIDPANLQVVREGMRQAVTSPEGSSYSLNFLPVKAAAKTGTAQFGKKDYYHKWITVFAPYDEPQIVLTIMIENVKGLQVTTLPVVRSVLDWYFSR